MSRAKHHESLHAVQLFPFVAVLLCTMGSLLVLLVAVARSSKVRAEEEATVQQAAAQAAAVERAAESKESVAAARLELEKIAKYQAELAAVRARAEERLREDRARMTHLEDHMRRLREKLESLKLAAAELNGMEGQHFDDRKQGEEEILRLEQLIAESRSNIQQLRADASRRAKSYAIVPYEGKSGTRRRPIYIECRAGEVVLQPEGIAFTIDDFRPPIGPGNPLVAAVRAAREHIIHHEFADAQGKAAEPYPLIIVRPQGVKFYYYAREAIQSWDSEFGYELVEEDWDLKYGTANPQLAAVESDAAELSRGRLRALAAAAPQAYGAYRGGGGGGVRGYSGGYAGPDFSDDESDSSGYGYSGHGGGGGGAGSGTGGSGYGGGGTGGGGYARGGAIGGAPGGSPGGATGGVAGGATDGGPRFASGPGGGNAIAVVPRSRGTSTGTAGGGTSGAGTSGGSAEGGHSSGSGGTGSQNGLTDDRYAMKSPTGGASPGGGYPGGAAGGGSSGNGQAGENPAGMGSPSAGGPQTGSSPPQGSQPLSPDGDEATDGAPENRQYVGGYNPEQQLDQMARDAASDEDPDAARRNRTKVRGKNWAIRNANPGQIPIRRTIQIVVRGDAVVILPESAGATPGQEFPFGDLPEAAYEDLAAAVDKRIKDWGMAGKGLYWRPVVELKVTPDGDQRIGELAGLLRHGGVEVRTADVAQHAEGGAGSANR